MARQRIVQAINAALVEEMERDPTIILFGEDVKVGLFGDTRGLQAKFGPERVRNTPICETLIAGMAAGAAAAGCRVVAHMMFGNFVHTGFDAIANQVTKLRFMSGGQVRLPVTYLATFGGGRSNAAQHSDTPYPQLMNLGGINVAVPANSGDAKGLLKTAIRGNNPTFFLQAGGRGGEMGEVPDQEYLLPFGKAAIRREGSDVTLVAIGAMVRPALDAAEQLAGEGLEVEVIDPRTLVPFDEEALLASLAKTGALVIADEARDRCSAASHIAAIACDRGFASLRAPVKRVTVPNVAIPYAPVLEKMVLPNAVSIAQAVRGVAAGKRA